MSSILYLVISPVLLLISVPLAIFATFTTTLAFSTLFFRALLVYVELAAAVIQNQFAGQATPKEDTVPFSVIPPIEGKQSRRKSRRSSAGSGSSNGGSVTPKIPESTGFGIYSGGVATRDFEGVGGWRIQGPDDEEELWRPMNTRLELPAMVEGRRRNHHRSRTSGSVTSIIPLPMKSPGRSRERTPMSTRVEGSTSPQEYFGSRVNSKSATDLDAANIGKALLRHKPSTSSSGSSQSSVRTLQLTQANT
ncbi:hypothetical protein MMC28_010295 [Mycoblastus sanguinarius]|nr:hypothetical protein [Mycoblastus sanguinarius]